MFSLLSVIALYDESSTDVTQSSAACCDRYCPVAIGQFGHFRELVACRSHFWRCFSLSERVSSSDTFTPAGNTPPVPPAALMLMVPPSAAVPPPFPPPLITIPLPLEKSGRSSGLFDLKNGEYLFPFVGLFGAVECGEDKHKHFGAHTDAKQCVAARQVQDFEQCTPNHNGCTYTVSKIEEAVAPFHPKGTALLLFLYFLYLPHVSRCVYECVFNEYYLRLHSFGYPMAERTQRNSDE